MENITKSQWEELVNSSIDAVIIDVRTPAECKEGIIENAIMLDIFDGSRFLSELEKLDKTKEYFVYCRSGNRSSQACSVMDQKGFSKTYNLIGGMMNWNGKVVQPS